MEQHNAGRKEGSLVLMGHRGRPGLAPHAGFRDGPRALVVLPGACDALLHVICEEHAAI